MLAIDRARYVGDPVAAVAAPRPCARPRRRLALVEVEYEELPAVFDAIEAAQPGAPLVHEQHAVSGGAAAYFAHATAGRHERLPPVLASVTATSTRASPTRKSSSRRRSAPQPPTTRTWSRTRRVARWDGDALEIWTGTQTPFNVREDLARVFEIAGGTDPGRRARRWAARSARRRSSALEAIAAALARKAGRPVKLVLPRSEEWRDDQPPPGDDRGPARRARGRHARRESR